MSARQQHGFDYQEYMIKELELRSNSNYIGENDAYYIEKDGEQYNVNIKFMKNGAAIELGDYRRNKNKDEPFALIVGFWKGIKGNIIADHIIYPPINWWHDLFLTDKSFDDDLFKFLKYITNDKSDDALWKSECEKFKNRWNYHWEVIRPEFEIKYNMKCPVRLIQPRFKRDHKNQKRIQCAIPNKLFYEYFLNY